MPTKVKELMTKDPIIVSTETTLQEAARKMKSLECGVLPVGSWEQPEGIITDRDIVIRAVADGVDITMAQVSDYMTRDVYYCREDDTLEAAGEQMRLHQVSRLMVKNQTGRACGIITFGCILRGDDSIKEIGKVVECAVGKKAA